jgi:RsiW-degrading membrane proteinase PrsW (M82 family)
MVGLFTATIGILILLGLQALAHATRGVVLIGGILSLPFWALKLLAGGYDIALDPNTGFVLSAFGFTVSVGVLEEGVKALPIMYLVRKGGVGGWRSMCVLGLASGAGFGISEGIQYCSSYYNGIYALNTYLVRFTTCVALHAVWSGTAGIFAYQQRKRIREAEGIWGRANALLNVIVLSVLLHGLYDTLLKKEHDAMALAAALVTIGVLAAQIEFMRRKERPALAWQGR